MRAVKQFLRIRRSPTVGTALLVAFGLLAPAHGAYTVLDDAPTVAAVGMPGHSIPFFRGRFWFGPRGRQAVEALLPAARLAARVVVVGHPDATIADAGLARRRAEAIRALLVAGGVSRAAIVIETASAAVSAGPGVFQSQVKLQSDVAPAPADVRTVYGSLPGRSVSSVSAVLSLYRQSALSADEAMRLLASTVGAPTLAVPAPAPTASVRQVSEPSVTLTTPTAVPVAATAHLWRLRNGRTLRDTLADWAAAAGWKRPVWRPADPYMIDGDDAVSGSWIEAVTWLAECSPGLDFHLSLKTRTITVTEIRAGHR